MQQLGELLRRKRQEMSLSLKEVEHMTSIRMNYLKAIEEGQITRMISSVYARGFLKQYANFLNLDIDNLLKEHDHLFAKSDQEFAYGIGTLEPRATANGGIKWMPNYTWIGATLAVLLAAWGLAKLLGVL